VHMREVATLEQFPILNCSHFLSECIVQGFVSSNSV